MSTNVYPPTPVSGTVTANLGTIDGAATTANQTTANASLSSIDGKLTSPVTVTGPLTDTQLRATPVPVSGTVATGGLTDTQLRATPVPVSGTVTATGPLTDTQLRAVAVPVSGTFFQGTQPVSAASLPLPTGAATEATLLTRTKPADQQHTIIDSGTTAVTQGTSPWVVSGTANPTTPVALFGFVTAVTTAGTRVQLANHAVVAGILQAPSTNSGLIYVGDVTVSSSVYGAELQPGQASGIAIDNTNRIYIDSSVNGDKCAFLGS